MKYEEWKKKPSRFLAMTGYHVAEFEELLSYFREAHDNYFSRYQLNGKRKTGCRKFVLYSNSPLPSVEERLVFILSYLKLNPIQEAHADLFGMEQYQCNQFLHALRIILDDSLSAAKVVPAQNQAELDEKLTQIVGQGEDTERLCLLHDATEREIPRPGDNEVQREKYSGKKKKHTAKNAVVINAVCMVLYLSATFFGGVHDKKIADTYSIRTGFTLFQDTGYQGYKSGGCQIVQPTKKPRGKELTQEQKEENQRISSLRVRVEHAIGSVKRLRIVKDECRVRKNDFVVKIMPTAVALHNFRLRHRPCTYESKLI